MTSELFEDKVSLYFDDALDADGIAELNRLLTRPELAARFVRLARIHGSLRERLQVARAPEKNPDRRRQLLWILPAAAAAAFLILAYTLSLPGARLEAMVGQVRFDGRSLVTSAASSASVVLPDGTRLLAGADTAARLDRGALVLKKGRVAAEVAPRKSETPLSLRTPHAEVQTLGGRLIVSVEGNSTHCRVEQGRVRVVGKDPTSAIDVSAGYLVVATSEGLFPPEPLVKAEPKTGEPNVRIIAPERWPKSYQLTHFRKNSLLYGDRGWRISEIPREVDGALGIVTLAEDRFSREPELVIFEVDRDALVWVGIDDRAAHQSMKLPDWLSGWEDTSLRIHSETASNSYYHLYRKRFPAGKVVLGGNLVGGDTGAVVNYTVLVTSP